MKPVALALLLWPALAPAAEVYKCVAGGRTVYQSAPCAPGAGDRVQLGPLNTWGGETLPPGGRDVAPLATGPGWHSGADGYVAAKTESERAGLPLLVYFYTDWCPNCRHFDAKVLPDPAVAGALGQFVKVRIIVEQGNREAGLHKLLGGRGVPHLVAQGAGLDTITLRGTGDARQFARALKQVTARTATPR